MLAYVFWHRPGEDADPAAYEARLAAFHAALAAHPPEGFSASAALRVGGGPLLESVQLFDIYTGPQIGEGRKSLAFALRFRAPDRTLTDADTAAARDAAVAQAARDTGAVQRTE